MTDEQKLTVLRHLAEKVMGWESSKTAPHYPLYFHEFQPGRATAIVFSPSLWVGHPTPPMKWNPFESAEDALQLLDKVSSHEEQGAVLDHSPWLDNPWGCEVGSPHCRGASACEAITLACYRATGGADV